MFVITPCWHLRRVINRKVYGPLECLFFRGIEGKAGVQVGEQIHF